MVAVSSARNGGLAGRSEELPADARVMLVVVAPDLRGIATPVAVTLYPAFPSGPASEPVNPETSVTVSGTSANTLRAAYPFGGGAALSTGIGQARGIPAPYWIVVDDAALQRLATGASIPVQLDKPIDVFDGKRLSSFPSGTVDAAVWEIGPLMAGVARLSPQQAAPVRTGLAAGVLRLAVAEGADTSGVATDMTPAQLSEWLTRMRPYAGSGP
jgi:hypothetical protein